MRLPALMSLGLLALCAISLAGVVAQTGGGGTPPPVSLRTAPVPAAEEPPKIVRWVCTDRICGGCDGQCARHGGHVAVSRRGHCACTPEQGSKLDRAIREAFLARRQGR